MTCSHDSLSSDTAPDTPPTHASVESMTGHPPGRVTVASACRSPWPARSARRAGRPALDQVWLYRSSPAMAQCRDQRPTHAATSRSWRDSVGPLMLCGASPTGVEDGGVSARSWSAPCRWAGGRSVPDPAKDVTEDVQDAPRGQPPRARARPRRVRLRSGGRSSHAPVLQPKRGAAHHRSGPAILGRRHRFPVRYDSSDRRKDRLPQEFKHGRPPGLHPHRVRTRGSEMAMILPVGHPSRPADRATDGAG
jgi:hypothetical protein